MGLFKVFRIFVRGFRDSASYPQCYVKLSAVDLTWMFEVLRILVQGIEDSFHFTFKVFRIFSPESLCKCMAFKVLRIFRCVTL